MERGKTFGIIGGMGPLAGADLLGKIIRMTDAARDQEHVHIILDSDPYIPDRTDALLHRGASPLPELIASAKRLEHVGVAALALACNTAHCFYPQLQEAVGIPILHMLRETGEYIRRCGIRTVGLLATDGTLSTDIYPTIFAEYGIDVITPSADGQNELMRLIYDDIKSGLFSMDDAALDREFRTMRRRGAELLVLGCTELPLASERYRWQHPMLDPTSILAEAVIRWAGKRVKHPAYRRE